MKFAKPALNGCVCPGIFQMQGADNELPCNLDFLVILCIISVNNWKPFSIWSWFCFSGPKHWFVYPEVTLSRFAVQFLCYVLSLLLMCGGLGANIDGAEGSGVSWLVPFSSKMSARSVSEGYRVTDGIPASAQRISKHIPTLLCHHCLYVHCTLSVHCVIKYVRAKYVCICLSEWHEQTWAYLQTWA